MHKAQLSEVALQLLLVAKVNREQFDFFKDTQR